MDLPDVDEPYGLAAIGSQLYMVGESDFSGVTALYTLNAVTGVATRVGDESVIGFGVGESIPTGLAAIGSTLYMVGGATDALYTLEY